MTDSEPLRRYRYFLQAFRQAAADRTRREASASSRLAAEQQSASQEHQRARRETEEQRARAHADSETTYNTEKAAITNERDSDRKTASALRLERLKEAEDQYGAAQRSADDAQSSVRAQSRSELNAAETQATAKHLDVVSKVNSDTMQMRREAEDVVRIVTASHSAAEAALRRVGMGHLLTSVAESGGTEPANSNIPGVTSEGLATASAMVQRQSESVIETVNDLLMWRATKERLTKWAVGVLLTLLIIGLCATSIIWIQQQVSEVQIRTAETAQAQAVFNNAVSTSAAIDRATISARATLAAQDQATISAASAQSTATAAAQARSTIAAKATEDYILYSALAAARETQAAATATTAAQSAVDRFNSFLNSGNKAFGPVSGDLIHRDDGFLSESYALGDYKNFIVSVRFFNPAEGVSVNQDRTVVNPWQYMIGFRSTSGNAQFRLVFYSGGGWNLLLVTQEPGADPKFNTVQSDFQTPVLRTAKGAFNFVSLAVKDDQGLVFVNGNYITELDLSGKKIGGSIWVGADTRTSVAQSTHFEALQIWAVP